MKPKNEPVIKGQFTPIDSKKTFSFQIPANIHREIQNLDPDEMDDIYKSVIKTWDRAHEEWQAAGDVPFRQFLEAQRKFNLSIPVQYDDFVAEVLKVGKSWNDRKIKDTVLRLIKSSYYRTLNSPDVMQLIKNAVQIAVDDNDHDFFKRFGRELEKPALPYNPPKEQTPLEHLLMTHWVMHGKIVLHLCCFTDEALNDFLHFVAPEACPTFDAVRKTRQRLHLKQTKRKLVKTVVSRGESIVLG